MIRQRNKAGLRYLLLPFTVALIAAAHHAQNLPDLSENIMPSVVYIATFDATGKPMMRGTGFALESNRVITNYHVIGGASRIEVRTSDRDVFLVTSVSPSNKDTDLAVLQLVARLVSDRYRLAPCLRESEQKSSYWAPRSV